MEELFIRLGDKLDNYITNYHSMTSHERAEQHGIICGLMEAIMIITEEEAKNGNRI